MPPEEAEPRFEEGLSVLIRAWTSNDPFSHRGRHWHFDDVIVEPPPAQRPHPPLWMAASSPNSIRDCARRGFNLLLDQFASPELTGARLRMYSAELEAAGHVFDPMRVAVARNFWVAADAEESEEATRRQAAANDRLLELSRGSASRPSSHILGYSDGPGAREEHALIGTPDQISKKLEKLRSESVAYVLLSGQGSRDNLRRFARDVMPAFSD
jgi:alkanesulfonate monooxygenase SsuD/methylene tetrahydromethanopterin reductase-like flavin-dependent oxidoreductase (luciferase family)